MRKLLNGKRRTRSLEKLEEAMKEGILPERRRGGFSNYNILSDLVSMGLMEVRYTGPRGGMRYHTTPKGRQAVMEANFKLASMSAEKFSKQFD